MSETKTDKPITFGAPNFIGQRDDHDEWMLYAIEEGAFGKVIRDALFISLPHGTVGTYNETLA